MSTVTSDQAAFETAYGAAAETISFAALVNSYSRAQMLRASQALHPTLPGQQLVRSRHGVSAISLYAYAFDTGVWQIGSTNQTIASKLPAVYWNADSSVAKIPGYLYLWLIAPTSAPFSLLTSAGFRGVIPETAAEDTFFFSENTGVLSLSYDYAGGTSAGTGDLWQGSAMTWQGDAVTW